LSEHRNRVPGDLQIVTAAIRVFADDGTLDLPELDYLLAVAMRDGTIDAEERRVLAHVLGRVSERDVAPEVWRRIGEVRAQYGI